MATTDPIREKEQIRSLSEYFLKRCQFRNYALVSLGIYTTLRIGDLLALRWDDVYDEQKCKYRSHLVIKEQKNREDKDDSTKFTGTPCFMCILSVPARRAYFCK